MHPEEYLEGYYDYEAAAAALIAQDYETAGKLRDDAAKLLTADYGTDSEEFPILINCMFVVMQYHVTELLLYDMGCALPETYTGRQAMLAAYAAWKRGESPAADWLTEKGFAVAVVKYRLPKGDSAIPLGDVHNVMRFCRDHQQEWGIDSLGIMGFSAGGHLAASASVLYDDATPKPRRGSSATMPRWPFLIRSDLQGNNTSSICTST